LHLVSLYFILRGGKPLYYLTNKESFMTKLSLVLLVLSIAACDNKTPSVTSNPRTMVINVPDNEIVIVNYGCSLPLIK
jgi:hypothetical protein